MPESLNQYLVILMEKASKDAEIYSSRLQTAEHEFLEDLFHDSFNEDLNKLEKFSNHSLSILLQTWYLYPYLICDKEAALSLLDILELSNIKM